MKPIFFLLILLSFFPELNGQVTFQAIVQSGSTEGENDIDYGDQFIAQAQSSKQDETCSNSSALAISSKYLLQCQAFSEKCALSNRASALSSFSFRPKLWMQMVPNGPVFVPVPFQVPLVFQIGFNGKAFVHTDIDNRWSAAGARYTIDVTTKNGLERSYHYIGAQRGVLEIYKLYNMSDVDGYVTFKPQIKVNNEIFDITDKMDKIVEQYEKLSENEKSENDLNISGDLRGLFQKVQGLQTWDLSQQSIYLDSANNRRIKNILEYYNLITDLGLLEGSPFSIVGSTEYTYEGSKDITLVSYSDGSTGQFSLRASVSASSANWGETEANASCGGNISGGGDAYSGLWIKKISLGPGFDPSLFEGKDVKLIIEETNDTFDVEYDNPAQLTELSYENDLLIYPNPTQGSFVVKMFHKEANEQSTIEVYSQNGTKVLEKVFYGSTTKIELNELENGLYFVRLWDASKTTFIPKKIVKF